MLCPNCQAEVREGAVFCGACGGAIVQQPTEGAPVGQPTEPLLPPTAPLPEPAAAAPPTYDPAAYQQQQLAYQQQMAAYERQYGQQQVAQVPPKKRKAGLIIVVLLIGVLLLVGCGVGGFFAYRALSGTDEVGTELPLAPVDGDATDTDAGFSTAEEALQAQLALDGTPDWVYQLYDEGDGFATYWVGPPQSEWAVEYVLYEDSDGSWSVGETNGLDFGGDVSEGDMGPSVEAQTVVFDHLTAVMEDRGMDAQAYTVDPFRSDSASAQVSAGGFGSFEVVGATEQSDGTFWVQTVQQWYGSVENWEYWVVPTELGYRIADVRPG
jgi:hypothetical protein